MACEGCSVDPVMFLTAPAPVTRKPPLPDPLDSEADDEVRVHVVNPLAPGGTGNQDEQQVWYEVDTETQVPIVEYLADPEVVPAPPDIDVKIDAYWATGWNGSCQQVGSNCDELESCTTTLTVRMVMSVSKNWHEGLGLPRPDIPTTPPAFPVSPLAPEITEGDGTATSGGFLPVPGGGKLNVTPLDGELPGSRYAREWRFTVSITVTPGCDSDVGFRLDWSEALTADLPDYIKSQYGSVMIGSTGCGGCEKTTPPPKPAQDDVVGPPAGGGEQTGDRNRNPYSIDLRSTDPLD